MPNFAPGKEITQTAQAGSWNLKRKDMITKEELKKAAQSFLNIADELNEKVSRYFDGSDKKEDEDAYWTVREADKKFIDALNSYYPGEGYEYGLNYELAESCL